MQAILQECKVKTDIETLDGFPCQILRNQAWCPSCHWLQTILQPCTIVGIYTYRLISLVSTNILVTQVTIRYTKLQLTNPIIDWLHELLLRYIPTCRYRWEELPLISRAESRRTIISAINLKEVLALIIVVQTTKETTSRPTAHVTRYRWIHRITISINTSCTINLRLITYDETCSICIFVFHTLILRLEACHNMEVMLLLQIERILRIELEIGIIILIVIFTYIGKIILVVSLTIQIIQISMLHICMTLIMGCAIVEDSMGNPILDWFDIQTYLMIILIILITICTTISHGVYHLIIEIAISIIQRNTWPLSTKIFIYTRTQRLRTMIILANKTERVVKLHPIRPL